MPRSFFVGSWCYLAYAVQGSVKCYSRAISYKVPNSLKYFTKLRSFFVSSWCYLAYAYAYAVQGSVKCYSRVFSYKKPINWNTARLLSYLVYLCEYTVSAGCVQSYHMVFLQTSAEIAKYFEIIQCQQVVVFQLLFQLFVTVSYYDQFNMSVYG